MADGLEQLEHRLGKLVKSLDASGRVRLAHQIGRELRRSQTRRIRDNLNPDGSPMEPRKERPLRAKQGRIKRQKAAGPMFRKMGQATSLSWMASPDGVVLGFAEAGLSRIAWVHQFGLRDRVSGQPNAPQVQYPVRQLLGLTDDDRRRILDIVLQHLGT